VSEPPEQEDEAAADADLEELLEQFREPEEPPKKRANPLWAVSGVLLSVLACWLALRASGGEAGGKPKSAALAGARLPGKASERAARAEDLAGGNVVEDYLTRCKKGMTAQELRWIVEDFQKAGLDAGMRPAAPEAFAAQRKAQHSWYLDLLAEGLGLSNYQRLAASEELDALLSEALERFGDELAEKASEVIESSGQSFRVVESGPIDRLISAGKWLADERYAPWELCELTKDQMRLTWFGWVNSRRTAEPDSLTYEPDMPWFDDRMVVGGPSDDGGWTIADFPTGDAPAAISGAGSILPFVSVQRFLKGKGDGVGPLDVQAMGCHPAQLKTLLLVNPAIAQGLLERLESVDE
jgi:hypothetical protein